MSPTGNPPRNSALPDAATRGQALWSRLEAMQLDTPDAHLTFTRRLARENGWSLAHARDVVAEYRRFLYLAARAGHPVTPCDAVDQAWHLHLVYTRHYWGVLCRDVLGFDLHHGPTLGGTQEQAKFGDWYGRTLESYRAAFGPPPAGIWPGVAGRFEGVDDMRRIDAGRNWVIPKPSLARVARLLGYALPAMAALLLAGALLLDAGSAATHATTARGGGTVHDVVAFAVLVGAVVLLVFLTWDTGTFLGSLGVVALLAAASATLPRGAAFWTGAGVTQILTAAGLTVAAFGLLVLLYRTRQAREQRRKERNAKNGSAGGGGCGGDGGGGCGGGGCGGCGG